MKLGLPGKKQYKKCTVVYLFCINHRNGLSIEKTVGLSGFFQCFIHSSKGESVGIGWYIPHRSDSDVELPYILGKCHLAQKSKG